LPKTAFSLKQIQWIWLGALIFALCSVAFGYSYHREYAITLDWRHWTAVFLAVWMVLSGFSFRRILLRRASAAFSRNDSNGANRTWSVAQFACIMGSVSVVMWGVVVATFGSPQWFPYPFYFVGILLLILYKPRKQPSERSMLK
jgi:hypothetical protein